MLGREEMNVQPAAPEVTNASSECVTYENVFMRRISTQPALLHKETAVFLIIGKTVAGIQAARLLVSVF